MGDNEGLDLKKRLDTAGKIFIGVFLLLLLRLWYLQIIRGEEYTALSQKNTIRPVRLEGIRGRILDRNGLILADNKQGFNVQVFRSGQDSLDEEKWEEFNALIGEDVSLYDYPLRRYATVKKDVCWETVAWVSERNAYLPELSIEVYPKRFYPKGEHLGHVLGYTGEITREELERLAELNYRRGDRTGKSGAERYFESYLRGRAGGKQVLVNAYGHQIDVLAYKKPLRGNDVKLTIDYRIQRIVEEEMEDMRGAVAVMNPNNGEILAMASRPVFDPNVFAGSLTSEAWTELLSREHSVFPNRVFHSGYPPGSTFKVVTAAAALEEGIISADDTFFCPGHFTMGSHTFRCWRRTGHGEMNLLEAMVYSCNVFFYNLGNKTGIENMVKYAEKGNFGSRTGIDLPAEFPGLFPSPGWKRERHGEGWYPGDTINVSIGQGYILSTPLQILSLYSAVAAGGIGYRPRIIHSVISPEGNLLWKSSPEHERIFKRETAEFLAHCLSEVVRRGTGIYAALDGVPASGKTGTAQNPHGENHAWFVGYAPAESPAVSVVLLFENAGQGSMAAAPVFKRIVERILLSDEDIDPPRL